MKIPNTIGMNSLYEGKFVRITDASIEESMDALFLHYEASSNSIFYHDGEDIVCKDRRCIQRIYEISSEDVTQELLHEAKKAWDAKQAKKIEENERIRKNLFGLTNKEILEKWGNRKEGKNGFYLQECQECLWIGGMHKESCSKRNEEFSAKPKEGTNYVRLCDTCESEGLVVKHRDGEITPASQAKDEKLCTTPCEDCNGTGKIKWI